MQDSNETVNHGKITKRRPQELRTAFAQLVLGIRRCSYTSGWRIMRRMDYMKKHKGSGKSIVTAAMKMAEITRTLLTEGQDFAPGRMTGKHNTMSPTSEALSTMNQ